MGGICTTGEKVPDLQRLKYDMTPIETNPSPIIWIVGPPGTGRHMHAKTLADCLELENVLVADLLRKEAVQETDRGRIIKHALNDPLTKVPDEIVVDLIKEAMLKNVQKKKGFLLNGFPRTSAQANMFVKEIAKVDVIIFLYGNVQVLTNRTKTKYDTEDAVVLKKSIQSRMKEARAGVSKFGAKLEKIRTDNPADLVYGRIEAAVKIRLNATAAQSIDSDQFH